MLPHDASEADKDGLLRVVEERFLACNDVEVDSFMQETFPGDASLFKRARSIFNDHALRDWVFSMNVCKGLAPACRDVASKWDMILETSMPAVGDHHALQRHNLSVSRNRHFFIRWRYRMAISMGKIQTREAFTRPQIAAKVAVALCFLLLSFLKGENLLKERSTAWGLGARVGPPPHPPLSPSWSFARPWNPFSGVCVFFCLTKVTRIRKPELASRTVSVFASGCQNQLKFN